MPTATVNSESIQFSYIDSGVPKGEGVFTTLIIIHGLGWSGDIFQKVVNIAPEHGIRVIALNRRDYGGSTPFTSEELAQLSTGGGDEGLKAFLRARSVEFAEFLQHIVAQGGIHKPNDEGSSRSKGTGGGGGVVFMGWSIGNVFGIDLIAQASSPTFPSPLKDLMETYVKTYILFDPSSNAFGLPYLQTGEQQRIAAAHPSDPTAANAALQDWLSGWFSYPTQTESFSSSTIDVLKRYIEPTQRPIRTSTWRSEGANPAFMRCFASPATSTNEVGMVRGRHSSSIFAANSAATMFNKAELWKGMTIKFVYCENSCWTCFYAGEKTEELWKEKGIERQIVMVRGANHFLQWEDPEKFLESIIPLL